MKIQELKKELYNLYERKTDWDCQCPPEKRGAEIALIKLITNCSWKKANKISFNSPFYSDLEKFLTRKFIK